MNKYFCLLIQKIKTLSLCRWQDFCFIHAHIQILKSTSENEILLDWFNTNQKQSNPDKCQAKVVGKKTHIATLIVFILMKCIYYVNVVNGLTQSAFIEQCYNEVKTNSGHTKEVYGVYV